MEPPEKDSQLKCIKRKLSAISLVAHIIEPLDYDDKQALEDQEEDESFEYGVQVGKKILARKIRNILEEE